MKRFSVIGLLTVLLTVVGLVPSCGSETALRDRIVVTALGLHGEAGTYTVSVQAIDSLKTASGLSEQSEAATAVYTASGGSLSAALDAFLEEAGRETYILQNRLITVSDALCRQTSLFDTMDYLIRHADSRSRVSVAVCRGDPVAILDSPSGNDAIPAYYPVGILQEGAANGQCVMSTLLDVRRAVSGMADITLPIFKVTNKRPVPDGTLLFRDGVAVGELNVRETKGLSLLMGQAETLLAVIDGVTYAVTSPHVEVDVTENGTQHAYTFTVSGEAEAVETRNGASPDVTALTRYLTAIVTDTLRALDAFDCDALGLARLTAVRDRTVTQKTARSQLHTCEKAVFCDIRLRDQRSGMERLSANE